MIFGERGLDARPGALVCIILPRGEAKPNVDKFRLGQFEGLSLAS
jgi:hypothetical protein